MNKDLDYYLNLDWTLIEGTDLDFNGNPYFYIEIKEIPSFAFCAKTIEKARENYKHQLKLQLMLSGWGPRPTITIKENKRIRIK